MKITLLNPPFMDGKFSREQRSPAITKSGTFYYPFWLAFAAGVLDESGNEVQLIDAPAKGYNDEKVLKNIKSFMPDMVVIDTSTPSIYNDVSYAEKIKEINNSIFTVLVGTHPTALPEQTMKLSNLIDAIALGEYDYTLRDLAYNIENKLSLNDVKGLYLKTANGNIYTEERELISNLDDLPFLSKVYKKYLNVKDYFFAAAEYPMIMLVTSRGCPGKCNYCVYPQVFHRGKYRFRSAKNLMEEIEYISKEFPEVKEIIFEDDTFTANKKRLEEFCDLMIEENIKIKWSVNARVDLKYETMIKMKKAGCRLLVAGFESGSDEILKNVNKGLTVKDNIEFMKNARKAKLLVHGCFMVGNIGETKETMQETFNLAMKLRPDTVQFFPLMVYPGTRAYDWFKQHNFITTDNFSDWLTNDGLHNCVVSTDQVTAEELVKFCNDARKKYYLNFRYIMYKGFQSLKSFDELKRNLKAFNRFKKYLRK